jgi:uncharacterized protein YdcH (DUF465 family)
MKWFKRENSIDGGIEIAERNIQFLIKQRNTIDNQIKRWEERKSKLMNQKPSNQQS